MLNPVLNRLVDRLTDNYNKNVDSNVNKLMQVAALSIQENEDVLTQIQEWRDIDKAEGTTLDRIGNNIQQNRGKAPDSLYRVLIKSKIRRNLSDGSINTLIDFLSIILQVDKTEVKITELWQEGKSAVIHVDVPSGSINTTGLSIGQFGTLLNLVVAAGVRAEVLMEGTFQFSSQSATSETDATGVSGFADMGQTRGGQLGAAYSPSSDYALPI